MHARLAYIHRYINHVCVELSLYLNAYSDSGTSLKDLNKVSAARWQALPQEEKDVYNKRAADTPSCATVRVKKKVTYCIVV